jgi:dTMP kinase
MPTNKQCLFLVVEGLDGAGTTTISARLADALRGRDLQVRLTAEPTDGPLGSLVRAHVKGDTNLDEQTAALVFTGDRADHLGQVIRPALRRGEWVVCDRYLLSTLAYQGAAGVSRLAVLAASEGFDVPDVTFVLDVTEEVRAQRLSSRETSERYEGGDLADVLRTSYEESMELLRSAGHRIEVIDSSQPIEKVLEDVLARLDLPG